MSITNLIFLLLKLLISHPLLIQHPIEIDKHNVSTLKSGAQNLIVTHYDCSPKYIRNMQYYKLKKLANIRSNPKSFRYFPPISNIFLEIRALQVRACAIHGKLSDKGSFCNKISLNRGFRFDHHKWYVNIVERPFYPIEIEARWELARVGLISKHNYHPQIIQFDVLDDPRWQAKIEAKQGRLELDLYRPFAFQHGSLMQRITPGLIVQDKTLNRNIMSSVH